MWTNIAESAISRQDEAIQSSWQKPKLFGPIPCWLHRVTSPTRKSGGVAAICSQLASEESRTPDLFSHGVAHLLKYSMQHKRAAQLQRYAASLRLHDADPSPQIRKFLGQFPCCSLVHTIISLHVEGALQRTARRGCGRVFPEGALWPTA